MAAIFPATFPITLEPVTLPIQLTLKVEMALATRATERPVWVDVSDYVYSVQIRRGRQHELDQAETGTCTVLLDNADRRFDPTYASGPYYGNLLPMRRLRTRATLNTNTDQLFTGYIQAWRPQWPGGADSLVEVQAADGFLILSKKKLNTSYGQELSSTRLHNVLDDCGWTAGYAWVLDSTTNSQLGTTTILAPVNDRSIAIGNTTVLTTTLEDTTALQHVRDVEKAENGWVYMGKDGAFVFINRQRRYQGYSTTLGTFGDDSSELQYSEFEPVYDDTDIYNEVRCQRVGGVLQTAENATSQLNYFERTLAQEDLLASTDLEMADRANWLVSRYANPRWRAPDGITFQLNMDTPEALWAQVLAREIGDRITINRRPQGGDLITEDYAIEGVSIEIRPGKHDWRVRWALSSWVPSGSATQGYWLIAGSATDEFAAYAVLGTTTVLAY